VLPVGPLPEHLVQHSSVHLAEIVMKPGPGRERTQEADLYRGMHASLFFDVAEQGLRLQFLQKLPGHPSVP
jgi:hypothetical protein